MFNHSLPTFSNRKPNTGFPVAFSLVEQNVTTGVAESTKIYLRKKFNVLITTGASGSVALIAKN